MRIPRCGAPVRGSVPAAGPAQAVPIQRDLRGRRRRRGDCRRLGPSTQSGPTSRPTPAKAARDVADPNLQAVDNTRYRTSRPEHAPPGRPACAGVHPRYMLRVVTSFRRARRPRARPPRRALGPSTSGVLAGDARCGARPRARPSPAIDGERTEESAGSVYARCAATRPRRDGADGELELPRRIHVNDAATSEVTPLHTRATHAWR